MSTTIEWTATTHPDGSTTPGMSWNFVTGCTEVSEGCNHCYAKSIATRFAGGKAFPHGFEITTHPGRLLAPKTWKKPVKVFVNSMSDLFHKDVPDSLILTAFDVMLDTPQHTYMILTKRPSRLANTTLIDLMLHHVYNRTGVLAWPANIWLGVSVESMDYTWRIDKLRQAFVAFHDNPRIHPTLFISAEPLLAPLALDLHDIAWLITGAESGAGARPMSEDWVRSLRDQAIAQNVAFFYKQKLIGRKKVGLPELDGRVWNEFPEVR